MNFAVGLKAVNKAADVMQAVALFKSIRPLDGGFLGLPLQPALAPAERGICSGKEDDFFVGVIIRFQSRWDSEVGKEYRLSKGTLFPKSMTMNKLVQLSRQADANTGAITKAGNASMHDKLMALGDQQANVSARAAMYGAKPSKGKSTLDIDLKLWLAKLGVRRTPFKITGGVGGQVGILEFGGGAGNMEITDTSCDQKKTFKMFSVSGGVSLAPASFSYSGEDAPSGSFTHLYQGPLNQEANLSLNSFSGQFVAAAGGGTGLAYGFSVTIYFLGIGLFDVVTGVSGDGFAPKWEMLQKAAGIAVVWGGQLGTPDVGLSIQTGRLLGDWEAALVNELAKPSQPRFSERKML